MTIPTVHEMAEAIKAADPSMTELVNEVESAYDHLGRMMWQFPRYYRCNGCDRRLDMLGKQDPQPVGYLGVEGLALAPYCAECWEKRGEDE